MSGALLDLRGLSAEAADGTAVLREVSLTVAAGQVLGLLGESGAGKSMIARAVLGILPDGMRVSAGEILFDGRDLGGLRPAARRRVIATEAALIPQDPQTGLNPGRRIAAQLTDGLRLHRGLAARAAGARARALLEQVQIADPVRVARCYPHQLSGGMRQRVLIAAAFALEPKLIVADEPTTALDVTVQRQILRLLRALQTTRGTAVLFVTHDVGVAAQICDRLAILFAGRVIETGPAEAVLTRPRHAYTRALLAAAPRHDRPDAGLHPMPPPLLAGLRAEIAAGRVETLRHD